MLEYSDNSYLLVSVASFAGFLEGQGEVTINDDVELTGACIRIINQYEAECDRILRSEKEEEFPEWVLYMENEIRKQFGKEHD